MAHPSYIYSSTTVRTVVALPHCASSVAVMAREADRCTLIRVGCVINSTQAAQNLPHPYTGNTTIQQVRRFASLCVGPFNPATTGKKKLWPWVWV